MKTFDLQIIEKSIRKVGIDAPTVLQAIDIANHLYKNEVIELEESDHFETSIDIIHIDEYQDHSVFFEFVMSKAKQTLPFLSASELAILAFGSLANAKAEFEKNEMQSQ
jgi:hypothetical protein